MTAAGRGLTASNRMNAAPRRPALNREVQGGEVLTGNAAILAANGRGGSPSRPLTGTTGILPVDTYGLAPDTPEPEIAAHLFKLYADKSKE